MIRSIPMIVSTALLCAATPSFAAGAADYCASGGSAAPRKAPAALLPVIAKAFAVDAAALQAGAYVRCVGGALLACQVGANLNCGKANRSRSLPGATAFCRQNPGSAGIPMAATGHDTIFDWKCVGTRAVPGKAVVPVDAGGYAADNRKEIN